MSARLWAILFAGFLACAPLAVVAVPSAHAQDEEVSYDSFHDALGDYGDWFYSDRWGEVWQPGSVDEDWRPYTVGHWVDTYEYGWLWESDEGPWSDIVYHYGRWVFDPEDGWLWVPGYVWAPAWVVWRSDGPYTGWMPMPPDRAFLAGDYDRFGDWHDPDEYFGYARWYGPDFGRDRFGFLWIFVPTDRIDDRDCRRFAVDRPHTNDLIWRAHNVTRYEVVDNRIVNRSVEFPGSKRGNFHHQIAHAQSVMRRARWVAPFEHGARVQEQMRRAHPRGEGAPQSAPMPPPSAAGGFSERSVRHQGPGPQHTFNRNDISRWHEQRQPQVPANFGAPPGQPPEPHPQSGYAPPPQHGPPPGFVPPHPHAPQGPPPQHAQPPHPGGAQRHGPPPEGKHPHGDKDRGHDDH